MLVVDNTIILQFLSSTPVFRFGVCCLAVRVCYVAVRACCLTVRVCCLAVRVCCLAARVWGKMIESLGL